MQPKITKKGYFFILDAMLSLIVLVIGVFLVLSSYAEKPQASQVGLLSDDLLNFLSNTKIKDLNNPFSGIGGELWTSGEIKDPDNSLLQQIGEFYAAKKLDTTEKFIRNISKGRVPEQYRYEVWIDNVVVYPKTLTSEHNISRNNSKLLLTSKKITFGLVNTTSTNLWGPYKAEVYVWER